MRFLSITLFVLVLFSSAAAQEKEKWQRLYTFDTSEIDIDKANVVFNTKGTGRVRFRISLSKSATVPGEPSVTYKRIIQTMEYNCTEALYRVYEINRFDGKGEVVQVEKIGENGEWKSAHSASLMEKLYEAACNIIWEKRRNP